MATTPKKKTETVNVQLMLSELAPDRTQYKQYGIKVVPMRVAVTVPVDASEVSVIFKKDADGNETEETDYIVLTLAGLQSITSKIADAIDEMHEQHLNDVQHKLQKGY